MDAIRVLILEDFATDVELIERELGKEGLAFESRRAADEPGFLRELAGFRPQLIPSDFRLPSFSGELALEAARREAAETPFIFVSGTIGEEKAIELMRSGATDCVFKYRLSRLGPAVRRALEMVREREVRRRAEQELQDQLHLLQVIGDAVPAPLFYKDPERRFLGCNRATCEVLRVTEEEVLGRRAEEFLAPEIAAQMEMMDLEVLRDRTPRRWEHSLGLPDGQVHALISCRAPLVSRDGTLRGLVGVAVDITDRKQAEEELSRALRLQEAVFAGLADAVFLIDPPTRRILLCNAAAERIFGYSRKQMEGRSTELLHVDRESFQEFSRRGNPQLKRRGQFRTEYRLRRSDGALFDAEVTVTVIDAEAGRMRGVVSVVRDITQRKRAERELRRREQEFQALVENAPDIIARLDADLRPTYINPAAERLLGVPLPELLAGDQGALPGRLGVGTMKWNSWLEGCRRVLGSGHEESVDLEIQHGGQPRYFQARIVPERDESGAIRSLLSVTRDLTALRRAEQALRESEEKLVQVQRLEAIGKLAGGVAHDFNNVLTAIQGYAELCRMKSSDSELREYVEEILRASGRAAGLTEQLLLFGRRAPMAMKPVDINASVEGLLKMLKRLIGENITVAVDLEAQAWVVNADPGKIEQVLMNLMINAGDAMPQGGTVTIATRNLVVEAGYVRAYPYARRGRFLCLSVEDTGEGMSAETLRQIFEPFFTTKPPGAGTGLGLAVVYGIVKEHGGWVNAETEPGRGSRFKVYLPASVIPGGEERRETPELAGLRGGGERLLVVEDEEAIRRLLEAGLGESGYEVLAAGSGREARELFHREGGCFHALLSDVVLPDASGLALYEELVPQDRMPAVFMSGYLDDKSDWERIREAGHRFLHKPVTVTALLKTLKELLAP